MTRSAAATVKQILFNIAHLSCYQYGGVLMKSSLGYPDNRHTIGCTKNNHPLGTLETVDREGDYRCLFAEGRALLNHFPILIRRHSYLLFEKPAEVRQMLDSHLLAHFGNSYFMVMEK